MLIGLGIAQSGMLGYTSLAIFSPIDPMHGQNGMIKRFIAPFMILILAAFAFPAIAADLNLDTETEARIKTLALEAILENPEILEKAIAILRQRASADANQQRKNILLTLRESLEQDANAPILGNADGERTIVEFFDYNCSFCKSMAPTLQTLLERNDNIRLVLREFPILSPTSVFAARAALAARKQNRYADMHWALLKARALDEQTILALAEDLGLDIEKLQVDMNDKAIDQHIKQSIDLAEALEINGTPSFIIDGQFHPGVLSEDRLKRYLAETP